MEAFALALDLAFRIKAQTDQVWLCVSRKIVVPFINKLQLYLDEQGQEQTTPPGFTGTGAVERHP